MPSILRTLSTVSTAASGGALQWGSASYAAALDGNLANANSYGSNAYSQYLLMYATGWNIPTNAVLAGCRVTLRKKATQSSTTDKVKDYRVRLTDSTKSVYASDRALSGNWSLSLADYTYGGTTDSWITSSGLTIANINANGLGVAFSAYIYSTNYQVYAYVDGATMEVFYTLPSTSSLFFCLG